MPHYDFRCRECRAVDEHVVPSGTDTLVCERCGGVSDRLPAAPAFAVKGFNAANHYGLKGETK